MSTGFCSTEKTKLKMAHRDIDDRDYLSGHKWFLEVLVQTFIVIVHIQGN